MKITLLTLFMLAALAGHAQNQSRATTWEEYNYLTSGQLNTILPGHQLRETTTKAVLPFMDGHRYVEIFEFYRQYSPNPCALLIRYHKEGEGYHCFCVPDVNSGSQMWNAYNNSLNTVNDTGSALQTITYALSYYLAAK